MAVKTITIDMEAYELLAGARRGNESFSTVIKETIAPQSRTAEGLLRFLETWPRDDELMLNLERVYRDREENLIAAEPLPNYARKEYP